MITIAKYRKFGGKRFTIVQAFMSKSEAETLAKRLRQQGKMARIVERAGELHLIKRFHVYSKG